MRARALPLSLLSATILLPAFANCSAPPSDEGGEVPGGGTSTSGGAAPGGASSGGTAPGGASPTGGSSGAMTTGGTGGAMTTGGTGGAITTGGTGGAITTGGTGGTGAEAGSTAGMGGTAGGGTGGTPTGGTAGTPTGGSGGFGGGPVVMPLNCGGKGTALENHGPPSNRVNYVIVGDGYSEAQLATGGTLDMHLQAMTAKMFSDPIGQPYLRYRNFINICVLRIPSSPICGSSTFGCCGSDSSRLANCNSTAVNNAIRDNLPSTFEVDWRAVVLNGSSWWNTGSSLMLWSGGNRDAAGAALHEGGHGFHQLADEYCASGTGANCGPQQCGGSGTNYNEVNSCGNCTTTDNKWTAWLDYNQTGATGLQSTFIASRYVDTGQYRPSSNSMMNSLFGTNPNTSFNAVSREKMIFDIWRIIQNPWDAVTPPAGAVTNPATLALTLIDPNVIRVDWAVDGSMVAPNGGPVLQGSMIPAGTHMVTATAYDNAGMDLVRQTTGTTFNRQYWGMNARKTVTWTVTK